MSRTNSYVLGGTGSRRVIQPLGHTGNAFKHIRGSREDVDMLPDDAVVRVITPDDKWNQTTLISSHDTVLAYFFSEATTTKLYKVCSGYYFALIIFIYVAGLLVYNFLGRVFLIPDWFLIIQLLNLMWAFLAIVGFSNRFLLFENLKCFETWYINLQGLITSTCNIHGYWEENSLLAIYTGITLFASYFCLSVCDAFNPRHKFSVLRFVFVVAIVALLIGSYKLLNGEYPPGFREKEYKVGSGSAITNAGLIARSNLVIILFTCKYLFMVLFYPEKLIIVKTGLENKKSTVKDLRQKCKETRLKHRLSQLPSMKMQQKTTLNPFSKMKLQLQYKSNKVKHETQNNSYKLSY